MNFLLFTIFWISSGIFKNAATMGRIRIIGGEPARAGQYPFAAAIQISTNDSSHFCGGSLLDNRWILTAAHCVENALELKIYLGSNNLSESDPNRVVVATSDYIIHPNYNSSTLDSDIALIRLHMDIQFSDYISWIYLPTTDVTEDTAVTSIGWGQTSDQETAPVEQLNGVNLLTISNDLCKVYYGNQITQNMVCGYGNGNEGTCTGDSGGPLVYYLNNRHPVHVATASFISANGCEGWDPSGYTRTHPFRNWILTTTGGLDPKP